MPVMQSLAQMKKKTVRGCNTFTSTPPLRGLTILRRVIAFKTINATSVKDGRSSSLITILGTQNV